ncbi:MULTISPECIES: hypothetical protein [Sphingobacterium]|uniref:Uncharacterized protein n=1 Tax=Sphingobacterium athyrii TaxID=2152717 RepID=A0A363NU27_9SPHI|nr:MULTISPECIES: hypothetical protein [Sphingobacterium]PUV24284.1 hypothetical protein DCO56_13085 [Sphingobacterium athyrii]QIH33979.1 hypothetical protein G6053_14275 [Sphingobacterium sp. DR205]
MKKSKLMIGVLGVAFTLLACKDRTNKTADDNVIATDSSETSHGVPLDNIHRSRPADTLQDSSGTKDQAVPLDNLDREKDGE